MTDPVLLVAGFLFGIVFGIILQRMSFCISTDLAQAFIGNYKRILTWFAIVFIVSSFGFTLLGPKVVGEMRGFGFYNVLAGIIFGIGIIFSGGCVLGTLRRMGEGFLHSWIVFFSWLGGMALVVYGIDKILGSTYYRTKILLPDLLGVDKWIVYGVIAIILGISLWYVNRK